MKKIRMILCGLLCMVLLHGGAALTVCAAPQTVYNSPYVTFSPDGQAWTTNAGDATSTQYEEGTTIHTGITSTLRSLQIGEHYYSARRTGTIPVGFWRVEHQYARCIHDSYPDEEGWHGLTYGTAKCYEPYYSGWFAYCADCGQEIVHMYFYANEDTISSIDYLDVGVNKAYYYLCPHCTNMEQGKLLEEHLCREISWNRYKVNYQPNVGMSTYRGYMEDSMHMYNNATMYEGQPVTPVKHLTRNAYTRNGYEFVEWNTEPDGSGTSYADGAEIFNLTAENWKEDESQGVITLYAQWRPSRSTLQIDPAGGSYLGNTGITSITRDYGTTYAVDMDGLQPPSGYQVSFDTHGGETVAPITSGMHFTEWSRSVPFRGFFRGLLYAFNAPDGNVDTLRANYEPEAVILPVCVRPGYSFGGWYYDAAYTLPAGKPGDSMIPSGDITLHAQWVELVLNAMDNYATNGGKGAVNLSWSQPDGNNKVYLLYQSRDGVNWSRINDAQDITNNIDVSEDFAFTGASGNYVVHYTGLYTLSAYGAQGGSYADNPGGKGGFIEGSFWLERGEVLTVTVGGRNGFNGGGAASTYAPGGGCTVVSSDRKGTLLIAGGGGGAMLYRDGGAGGSEESILDTGTDGGAGDAGGGGGYRGGTAGTVVQGESTTTMQEIAGETLFLKYDYEPWQEFPYVINALEPEIINGTVYYKFAEANKGAVYATQSCYCFVPDGAAVAASGEYLICRYEASCNTGGCLATGSGYHHTLDITCNGTITFYEKEVNTPDPVYTAAYGGSNYVNPSYCISYSSQTGVREGNGGFSLSSQNVGFVEVLELNGVSAPDKAAPDSIALPTVQKTPVGNDSVKITWEEPMDRGTDYYHVAESYLSGSDTVLSRSNVTLNCLTSGIRGYYTLYDTIADTTVTEVNGVFRTAKGLTVPLLTQEAWLHAAPVDVAGNLGGTVHIKVGNSEETEGILWGLYTEQLSIDAGDNVYPAAAADTYYVRSDGETPFMLHYGAYMDGPASQEYQINHAIFASETDAGEARNSFFVPGEAIQDGTIQISPDNISYSAQASPFIARGAHTEMSRLERNRRLALHQSFTMYREASGKEIFLIPIAGADYRGEVFYSEEAEDRNNALTLIGDGEAPVITGLELLHDRELINRNDGTIVLQVMATDDLSGVRSLSLKIVNTDNTIEKVYQPESDGCIRVDITRDEPVFSGDFTVTAHSVDNVGNERTVQYSTTEFALETSVQRILEPHAPVFRCGESGLLTIVTYGYAERVEVEFPPEMTALEPSLNQTFYYTDNPEYRKEEGLQFMIPLSTPFNSGYTITVRAYKGDRQLEDYPSLSVIEVNGSVLDEIRTRLR